MALHQIRTHSNALTYKIENISPSDDYDVLLTKDKKFVIKWRSCNDIENVLIPVTVNTHPGKLQKLTPPMAKKAFYGLTFDSYWSKNETSNNKIRGLSVILKNKDFFELYLHGGVSEKNPQNTKLQIGEKLDMNQFYTLQVFWKGKRITNQFGGQNLSNSFYSLYKDRNCLENHILFHETETRSISRSVFYVGGLNNSKVEDPKSVVKTNLFTGLIANLEVMKTDKTSLPQELADFIAKQQFIVNV